MDRVEYEKHIVQDLVNLFKSGELNINPWYQRRSVWLQPQKAYLINTLFEKKPIPSLYVRHSLDIDAEKSIREVVDGQQRIRAILEYSEDSFAAKHPGHPKPVKYSQLKRAEAESFKLTSLSVGYLLGATDEDVIEIFGRLNSVAKTLNPQEKRNAKFSGEFKQFCLRQAAKRLAVWRDLTIFSANDIARMEEVQFISDLTLNMIEGLSDYSTSRLDKMYEKYDEEFEQEPQFTSRLEELFTRIVSLKPESFRETVFRRPPLFFSLCLILDSAKQMLPISRVESALHAIDGVLSSDIPISERRRDEADFIAACKASTQRISQRTVRDSFIRKRLGL
ncbi:MAG TPA: DUF262 domain-containing protein [Terriglobia bacterium]|nr:DUF262 domain-containing protein [Terriglobia bacterium]